MSYSVPRPALAESFHHFGRCGAGRRECMILWLSPWRNPGTITHVVHPIHRAHRGGIELDNDWLGVFWRALAQDGLGIRVQIHTHPGAAFHSATDDEFPIVHTPGFLSLVIPGFGLGPVGFEGAYLAEVGTDGGWREAQISDHLVIV